MSGQDYVDLIQALSPLIVGVILPAVHRIVKRLKRIEERQLKISRKVERIERATARTKDLS